MSFLREKFLAKGGPNGGNGGKGGDVVLKVNPHQNNLVHLRFQPHQFAGKGIKGGSNQRTGKSGDDCVIEVPPGTCVHYLPTTEENFERSASEETKEMLVDMTEADQVFVLCRGGRGGKGNMNFASSTNQAPRYFQKGEKGRKGQYILELKSIANVGLVGLPNAGKSSLLTALSAARPKIAPYPFTTLQPIVGVVEYKNDKRVTVADIPGLVEGANEGVGLGHDFLRHIERCELLAFVIDMAGSEGRDPLDDYSQLRKEIRLYSDDLSKRPHFIVANKMDLPASDENLERFKKRYKPKTIPISAQDSTGLDLLKKEIFTRLAPRKTEPEP